MGANYNAAFSLLMMLSKDTSALVSAVMFYGLVLQVEVATALSTVVIFTGATLSEESGVVFRFWF